MTAQIVRAGLSLRCGCLGLAGWLKHIGPRKNASSGNAAELAMYVVEKGKPLLVPAAG